MPVFKRRRLSPPDPPENESSPSTLVASPNGPELNDFFSNAARWDLEQDYEQVPRKQKNREKESTRLPIKTPDGRVEQLQVLEEEDYQGGGSDSGRDVESEEEARLAIDVDEKKEPPVSIRQQILEAKEELARLAGLINENPEEHASAFRSMGEIAKSVNPTIKNLALVTQLAVFKDVIPGYRIRPISKTDMAEKLSKEVRRLRAFEQALVGSYQTYVKELTKIARYGTGDGFQGQPTAGDIAISCACALLLAVPHFNFRGELIKIMVNKLSARKIDANFHRCIKAIETLFRDDEDGTASLDVVLVLTRMMKARNYHVDESVLNTFLHLRLLSEFSSKASQTRVDKPSSGKPLKSKKEFRTKKQRKQLKELKAVEKDFKEADAIVSHEQRDKMQAEMLKLVFVTYFRILKARSPALMGAVLEGLAKYAHLINQDFFGDLLEALKDLINSADSALAPNDEMEDETADIGQEQGEATPSSLITPTASSIRSSLLCITTAFALLAGQDAAKSAQSLNLDLTFFTTHLYKTLHTLSLYPDLELSSNQSKRPQLRLPDPHSETSSHPSPPSLSDPTKVNLQTTPALLLTALNYILTPRTTPPLRVAAFTKQLLTTSLHLPEKSSAAVIALIEKVLKTHGKKLSGLWNTDERKGDGVFDPWRGDVQGSNPFAATVWEGELLRLHFSPRVRDGVGGLEKGLR
ncbi:hypothetical protein MMC31_007473 [Peltigera leucophlebia]|nr:hypothetical protein [Peltigera leucophlebia]